MLVTDEKPIQFELPVKAAIDSMACKIVLRSIIELASIFFIATKGQVTWL